MRIVSALGSFVLLGLLASSPFQSTAIAGEGFPPPPGGIAPRGAAPPSLAPVLARVSSAVVNVSVQGPARTAQNELFQDPLFRRFFGLPDSQTPERAPERRIQAAGSGVIYDAGNGYVLTNNHVVDRADRIQVTLTDRRRLDAKLVAADPQTDIAVLKVEPGGLNAMPLGDSKQLQVGDYVVALGNPFGVGQTATFGIVSALGRTGLGIESYEDFIQTDASVNPGNSGGALVDLEGRLIGINTAIISRGGGSVGIGFAIPIDMVKSVVQQLIASGRVSRGALGISIQDLTPELARAMQTSVSEGALVSSVNPQSAAARAGLQDGDVVTALDGEKIAGSSQLRNSIGLRQPGTAVRLTVLRDGRERTINVTLDPQTGTASSPTQPDGRGGDSPLSGMSFGAIPRDDPNYGRVNGVFITRVEQGSAAAEAGLREGDIVVSANRTPVSTPAELTRIMRERKAGGLLLQIRRGEASFFIVLG